MELFRLIPRSDCLLIGVERTYRLDHVKSVALGIGIVEEALQPLTKAEAKVLIATMDDLGLTVERVELRNLDRYASLLLQDPIALAVCRILGDFKPVQSIISSLIDNADTNRVYRYIAVALASYCYRIGISRTVLISSFDSRELNHQLSPRDVLPLALFDRQDEDYVIPLNPMLGLQILRQFSSDNIAEMVDIFCAVGGSIAPYVNRRAIQRRTPAAKLAGRLFDYDEVVKPFLKSKSEDFYLRMQRQWSWNSRYWEQMALYKLDRFYNSNDPNRHEFLSQSIIHAKHAVQIERHPLSLTVLGKILLEEMKFSPKRAQAAYNEAFKNLFEAATREESRQVAIHPYAMLFTGTIHFVEQAGILEQTQKKQMERLVTSAELYFGRDSALMVKVARIRQYLR